MSLEIHPEVERQVLERAEVAGISASDYIARLLRGTVPSIVPAPAARVRDLLREWQHYDHTPTAAPAPDDGTHTPSEALFRQWEREDAALTDAERRVEEAQWHQFQQGIDAERLASGMRPIF